MPSHSSGSKNEPNKKEAWKQSLLSLCFQADVLLGLLFVPEDGGYFGFQRNTRSYIPVDITRHSNRCENLKLFKLLFIFTARFFGYFPELQNSESSREWHWNGKLWGSRNEISHDFQISNIIRKSNVLRTPYIIQSIIGNARRHTEHID
jgi:hypothetical protein